MGAEGTFRDDRERKTRENFIENGAFVTKNRPEAHTEAKKPARANQQPDQQENKGDGVIYPIQESDEKPELHFFQTIERRKETGLKILWVGCRALVEWGC